MHQSPQFKIVLAVGQGHFGKPVLSQDQLPGRRVLVVNGQHALFDNPRKIAPASEFAMGNGHLQAGAETLGMDITGQGRSNAGTLGKSGVLDEGVMAARCATL